MEPTRFATASPEVFGQQSPIRCPEDCAAWNLLDDSDMELFQNCSDPEESDEDAAVTAGEDVLGMTEICDLIDDSEAWAEEPLLDPARKDKMAGLTSGVSGKDYECVLSCICYADDQAEVCMCGGHELVRLFEQLSFFVLHP